MNPCRVAIAGCGAVTRLYYAPALAALAESGEIELAGVFDPDRPSAEAVARRLGARAVDGLDDLLAHGVELVIVASPPAAHAAQAIAAIESGADVLCEKPLAPTLVAAQAMVAAAERSSRCLSVGHVRRQFPATQAIRDILGSGLIGDIRAVTCFEGGPFDWPIAGPAYFSRAASGGGVLLDLGPHVFDLLTWWLGSPHGQSAEDDAMGGIEANCRVRLDYGSFAADIRLSRDWARPNLYRFEGTKGRLEWVPNDAENLTIKWFDRPEVASIRLGIGHEAPFHRYFERQLL